MFSVELDMTDARGQVTDLQAALARQRPQLLAEIGRGLVEAAHRDFAVKSRGGTGADGVRWPVLTPEEARRKARHGQTRLGVRSGDMAAIIIYTSGGPNAFGKLIPANEVVIDYADQPKANYFNARRSLLPSTLPDSWYRQATATVDDHLKLL